MTTRRVGLKSALFTDSANEGQRPRSFAKSAARRPNKTSDGDKDKVHKINITEMRAKLQEFRKYADVKIENLPPDVKVALENFSELISALSETAFYSQMIDIIEDVFRDVTIVKPMTVGEYFRGCFVSNSFNGPIACSTTCAGMISPPQGIKGWAFCEQNVIRYDGNKLEFQYQVAGCNKAIVHVVDDNQRGFTQQHIQQLMDSGIQYVTLYLVAEDGKYVEQMNTQPVGRLPLRTVTPPTNDTGIAPTGVLPAFDGSASVTPAGVSNDGGSGSSGGGIGLGWLFLLIIIIIIIGVVIWLASRRQESADPLNSYDNVPVSATGDVADPRT